MKFSVKAFLLGVILSAVFVSVKNIYSCEISADIDKGIFRAMKLGNVENLYIGSSMFRKGITLYDDKSDSFLIYYNGLDPVNEYIILEYMFSNGLHVKNLFVDLFPNTAAKESWLYDTRMMFDSPLDLKLSVLKQAMKNSQARIFPTIWELLVHSGNDMFILWPMYSRLVSRVYHRGGYSRTTFTKGKTPEAMSLIKPQQPDMTAINPEQRAAIIRIIETCRENGVNVTFVETPKYSAMFEGCEYRQVMGEYLALLGGYGAGVIISRLAVNGIDTNKPGMIVYDFPHDDASLYEDNIHLSTEGSRKFMSILRYIQAEKDLP